ncbi:hypothetical protein BDW62DRAFT_200465 [Aspergillus aurantiobrunneus]
MLLARRDDGLTCRQRMLRAMMAESSSKTTSSLCKEEMKPRWDNAKKILADGLLDGPLQLLLKDNAANDEQRAETVELFVLDIVHGPETNEHVVCKAIVAVAKKGSPLDPLYRNDVGHRNSNLFGNFVPEIAEKLYGYFRPQFDMAPLEHMVFMRPHRSYSG